MKTNVKNNDMMKNNKSISKIIRSFGLSVLPIVTLNEEVASMGTLVEKDIVDLILKKIK